VGLKPFKTLRAKGMRITYRNNFFTLYSIKDKTLTTGLVTPYNGFIHLAQMPLEHELLDIKIDTLGNVAILTPECIYLYDIFLKTEVPFKFEYKLQENDKFRRIEFGKYDSALFYLVSEEYEVVSLDFENKLTQILQADKSTQNVEFSPNMQWVLVTKKIDEKLNLYVSNLSRDQVHKFKRCLCNNKELNHTEIYQVSFS
jgi:hypothetical protein